MSSYCETEFMELCKIGSGGYSTVFKVKDIQNGKVFAIKKIPLNDSEKEMTTALKEINFLGTLSSDYIVEHIHSWIENNYYNSEDRKTQNTLLFKPEKPKLLHIQMELCSLTLHEFIKSQTYVNKNTMTAKQYSVGCDIFTQLLECVQYLHERNPPIIHRDLKPLNILLSNADNNRCVKLTDFGLSTYHEFTDQSHTSRLGTDGYRAPELTTGRNYTIKADIYSLGRIIEQLFNIDVNSESVINAMEFHQKYEKVKAIFLLCLSPFANKRPNCEEILNMRNDWESKNTIAKNLFSKIKESYYESAFNFNFEKWPLIINIDLELIKNCKSISIIEQIEEKAIFFTKDRKAYALRVSDHIDSAIQEPNIINELSNQEIKSIVSGDQHVLCLTKDMRVYSFGDNSYEQLANRTNRISNNKPSIIEVLNEKRITDIKCGAYHSLALSKSGRVYAWGGGWLGQIGNGENNNKIVPIEILSLKSEKIISISCGYHHCLALSESKMFYGWGDNEFGQLGIGNNDNQNKPILISFNDQITVKKISCGINHSLILTSDNDIYSFGNNNCGQLGIGSDINQNKPTKIETSIKFIDIETTFYHRLSVGLSKDNKYYVWGECSDQSINTPKQTEFSSFNEAIIYNSNTSLLCKSILTNESFFTSESLLINKLNEMSNFQKLPQLMKSNIILLTFIRLTECKVILVTNDDMVYSIRLNDSIDSSAQQPVIVNELSEKRIKNIICGKNYVLCLTENNEVYSFGDNRFGQLGNGSTINNNKPTIITSLNNQQITDISCGQSHCLSLSESSGRVFVWGYGYYGQIGNQMNYNQFTPIEIKSLKSVKIISISCGAYHCLVLSSNGKLYGWGDNRYGQLGVGNNTDQNKPILIENNNKIIITKISCGYWHSLLLSSDHNIYSFGLNSWGQLGIGNTTDQNRMTKIETTVKFKDIQTNWCDNFSAGLSQTDKYYIWGKCGDQVITKPKQTHFISFDAIFATFSQNRFVTKQININKI